MNPSNADSQTQPKRSRFSTVLRCFGLFVFAVLTVLFGLIPFVLGLVLQAIFPRRLPPFVVGPLAMILFFVLWNSTGWLSVTIGSVPPVWPSVLASLVLFVTFFASGAEFLRALLPRRYSSIGSQDAQR
jgi:hypothetical protein